MKVLALGAAGNMGRVAVRTVGRFDFVGELTVADADGEAAASIAADLGEVARSLAIDIADERALAAAVRGSDAVLNTVGPFFRFGVPVLQACIEAGVHYLDINDDWEPTLEMLEHDSAAREAGITAIVGIGASPGVSNLLALLAMAELDTTERLITGWSLSGTGGGGAGPQSVEPSAAVVHFIHQITGTVRVRRGGEFVEASPLEETTLDFPGIGRGIGWTVGHPEPLTLPRYFPEIRESANVVVTSPRIVAGLRQIAAAVDRGEIDALTGAREMVSPTTPQPGRASEGGRRPVHLPDLFALATGSKDGRRATVGTALTASPPGGMGGITGIPLAIALRMLHERSDRPAGVFAPEALLAPERFFALLAPYCEPGPAPPDPLVKVTRSWA